MVAMKTLMILLMAAALAACAKPAAAPPKASAQKLQGQVLETLNAGGFTYVRLKTGSGDQWVVTSPVDVKVGSDWESMLPVTRADAIAAEADEPPAESVVGVA